MRSDHWRNEAEWLPESVEDLVELRRRIIELGHPAPVAGALIGWLLSKTAGEDDVTGPDTRSKYRKILAELAPSPEPSTDGRHLEVVASNGSRRKVRGRGVRKTVVALVLLGAASLGAGTHANGSISNSGPHSASPGASRGDGPPRIHADRRNRGSVNQRRRRAA